MNFPCLATRLFGFLLMRVVARRQPDFIVGADNPSCAYLRRWYLTPWRHLQTRVRATAEANPTRRNRAAARVIGLLPNLYLHEFLRDDDDRALHDHPSWAASFMLQGAYVEHTIAAGGIHQRQRIGVGRLRFLPTRHAHRIELLPLWFMQDDFDAAWEMHDADPVAKASCWTLFLFGPSVRAWGFHHPQRGWIHWQDWVKEFGA